MTNVPRLGLHVYQNPSHDMKERGSFVFVDTAGRAPAGDAFAPADQVLNSLGTFSRTSGEVRPRNKVREKVGLSIRKWYVVRYERGNVLRRLENLFYPGILTAECRLVTPE